MVASVAGLLNRNIRLSSGKEEMSIKRGSGESLLCGDQARGKGVTALIISFVEVAELYAAVCCMGKALLAYKDADVVDVSAFVAEKNKVAGAEALFRYHTAKCGKITGGAWQNHPEVFLVEVEHQPRTVEPLRGGSSEAVPGAEGLVNG